MSGNYDQNQGMDQNLMNQQMLLAMYSNQMPALNPMASMPMQQFNPMMNTGQMSYGGGGGGGGGGSMGSVSSFH